MTTNRCKISFITLQKEFILLNINYLLYYDYCLSAPIVKSFVENKCTVLIYFISTFIS